MKLTDWAKKQGISYVTAYRWFRDGKLPVEAYQSDSGTIIVRDEANDSSEKSMSVNSVNQQNDVMALFLKKTVEFSKNNSTVEDFAAYVISNFQLKMNNAAESTPKYSRMKPKPEDVQKHFQQFIKKGQKPQPNIFVSEPETIDDLVAKSEGLTTEQLVHELHKIAEPQSINVTGLVSPDNELYTQIKTALSDVRLNNAFSDLLSGESTEGVFNRTVHESTPLTYTNGLNSTFSTSSLSVAEVATTAPTGTSLFFNTNGPTGAFKPTQKELESAKLLVEESQEPPASAPKKRGRKPSKNRTSK
jgi:hypothetical protein